MKVPSDLIILLTTLQRDGLYYQGILPVGSRRTCVPPPMDTDDDWLLYFDIRGYSDIIKNLSLLLWVPCTGESYESLTRPHSLPRFTAWRKDDVNVIIAFDKTWYDQFCLATRIAKNLNLLSKSDRVTLFKTVRGEI